MKMIYNFLIFLLSPKTVHQMIVMTLQGPCHHQSVGVEVMQYIHWELSSIELLTGFHCQWCEKMKHISGLMLLLVVSAIFLLITVCFCCRLLQIGLGV